jgi:hypothetical protein
VIATLVSFSLKFLTIMACVPMNQVLAGEINNRQQQGRNTGVLPLRQAQGQNEDVKSKADSKTIMTIILETRR